MDPLSTRLALGAAGAAGGAAAGEYVEDVFSTYLYTGNSSTQTITNGIDLSGEGGMVWCKLRDVNYSHEICDTERGGNASIRPNTTSASTVSDIASFTSSGFNLQYSSGNVNESGRSGASWTFRKAPGFFDVVTYTGDGTSNRALNHSLGSTPGFIAIKATSTTGNWICWHRSLTTNYSIVLNSTDAEQGYTRISNIGASSFSVSDISSFIGSTNASGVSYVAYLFAHDEAIFGENADQSVIKCGSYTGNASTNGPVVNLGWEPQWVLIKKATGTAASWFIFDNMRGIATGGNDAYLMANLSNSEANTVDVLDLNSTGFQLRESNTFYNGSGETYIYIAIRRGPMKTPTDATDVFGMNAYTGDGALERAITTGALADFNWTADRNGTVANWWTGSRLTGTERLITQLTNAGSDGRLFWDTMDGMIFGNGTNRVNNNSSFTYITHTIKRAPGFFDVVAYDATGVVQTLSHNLGVTPECIIVKGRNSTYDWGVYHTGLLDSTNYAVRLNTDGAEFSSTIFNKQNPTSTNFYVNYTSGPYIAYLFATCPGVSKVGSYTGTAATLNVDCGFSAGARFVLIKRTDSTGDWYVWDTARGIVSGNDPYLLLNTTDAEVTNTDYIDPLNAGFTITSSAPAALNASGGNYIFLAIA